MARSEYDDNSESDEDEIAIPPTFSSDEDEPKNAEVNNRYRLNRTTANQEPTRKEQKERNKKRKRKYSSKHSKRKKHSRKGHRHHHHQSSSSDDEMDEDVREKFANHSVSILGKTNKIYQRDFSSKILMRKMLRSSHMKKHKVDGSWTGRNIVPVKVLASKTNWKDDNMLDRPGIKLVLRSDKNVVRLARSCLTILSERGSLKAAAGLMVVAWNLRRPTSLTPVFPDVDPTRTDEDTDVRDIVPGGNLLMPIAFNLHEEIDDVAMLAAGYSYFAASLLRLATKSKENYMAAFPKIKETFNNFYRFAFPISGLVMNDHFVKFMRDQLAYGNKLRSCLTGFLYDHENEEQEKGLRRYLYEQHLGCTGMHALNLSLRIFSSIAATLENFCLWVYHKRYHDALNELSIIIIDHIVPSAEANTSRQTWRYCRLFDPSYFVNLQTKNCVEFTYLLAVMAHFCNTQPKNAGNLFNIIQLKNLSFQSKLQLSLTGFRLVRCMKREVGLASGGTTWESDDDIGDSSSSEGSESGSEESSDSDDDDIGDSSSSEGSESGSEESSDSDD